MFPFRNSSVEMVTTSASAYKLTKKVVDIILDVEGDVKIFGGYVRDAILHDHHAKQFYMSKDLQSTGLPEMLALYSDPSFLTCYNERTIVPADIDCLMTTSGLDAFLKGLKDHSLAVLHKESHVVSVYQEGLSAQESKLKLTKLKLGIDLPRIMSSILTKAAQDAIKKLKVCVDVVHADDINNLDPPFGRIDFECNALILDKSRQITASSNLFYEWEDSPLDRLNKLANVVDDIKSKRAMACEKSPLYRTFKMMQKGWHIKEDDEQGSFELIPIEKVSEKDRDVCLICLDGFHKHKGETHVLKRSCCSARYHPKCFSVFTSKSNENFSWKCPMCACPYEDYEIDNREIVLW